MCDALPEARLELHRCRPGTARKSTLFVRRWSSAVSSGELVGRQHLRLTGPRCAWSFSINDMRKRGKQMASIKGVMFLPLDAESYRRHVAHHTFLAKVNSGTRTPDSRLELRQLVEERVRQEMQLRFSATRFRVLRWEQVDLRNRYVVRYRELDGVFETGNGATVLLEVKASASKGSLKTGLEQLRAAAKIASYPHARTIGVLVVADLGEWFDMFGQAAAHPLADYFAGMDLELLGWPPRITFGKTSGICVSLIPGSALYEWLPTDSKADSI